jgi:hypothetical protein
MGVHVYGFDPLSSDHNGEFLAYRLLSVGTLQETAAAEDDAGGDSGRTGPQKITACGHDYFPPSLFFEALVCGRHATQGEHSVS